METAVVIFTVLSGLFGIASLVYVGVDFVYEVLKDIEETEVVVVAEQKAVTVPRSVPEIKEEIPIVEQISAEDADEMISDALALSTVVYEEEKTSGGSKTFVNIGAINDAFEAGDTVDIDPLKQKGMIPKKTARVKILADGVLSKPLTVKANSYSVQAVKMIELTGGTVVLRKVAKNK